MIHKKYHEGTQALSILNVWILFLSQAFAQYADFQAAKKKG